MATGKSNSNSYLIAGKEYPILDRLRIRGRNYLLLERVGNADRERYLAVDPAAGPGGELRSVLILPRTAASTQHIQALKRATSHNANVPRLFDYQKEGNQTTLVVDWIRGPTLEEHFTLVRNGQRPRPSPYEAVRIIRGLAHGVSRLHRKRQVIHGDIKPANLVLSSDTGALVTIDFGSAWLAEKTVARLEGDGRSAGYAAPEQQAGFHATDFRADQFATAVVLFELLTLQLPYDQLGGKAGRPEFRSEMERKFTPPSRFAKPGWKLPKSIWQAIDTTVTTSLALDRDQRFPTHRAWLAALDDTFHLLKHPNSLSPFKRMFIQFITRCAQMSGANSSRN